MQIKSHAQKVLKRMDSGEDVFGRLEENVSRLHFLVSKIHETNGIAPPVAILQPASPTTTVLQQQEPHETQEGAATEATVADVDDNGDNNNKPRKRRTAKKKAPDGTEHILAASALCQLAGPESEGSSNSSMAEEATEEVAKMDDASKPDLLDMVPAEAALNDDNNNNNEAIEIGEGFAV